MLNNLHLTSTYVLALHLLLSPQHHPLLSRMLLSLLFCNFLFPSNHPNILDATSTKNFNLLRRTFSHSQLISISNFKYPSSTHLFSNSSLLPYNKLFRVDTSCTSSSYIKDNGRLFSTFSISNKTVEGSVNGNLSLPIDFFNCFFTIPTNLSQRPPHQGAPFEWNFHVIPRSEQNN